MSQVSELNSEHLRLYARSLAPDDAPLQVEDKTVPEASRAAAPEPGAVYDEVPSSAALAADCDAADELAAAIECLCTSPQPSSTRSSKRFSGPADDRLRFYAPKPNTWRASSGAAVLAGQAAVQRTARTEAVTRSKCKAGSALS